MARKQKGRKPEYIVSNKFTGEVKEVVHSTYAAKTRTLTHNNMAYTKGEGTPFVWNPAIGS